MNTISLSSIAVSVRGRGYGNPNASLERQGDAGWGVQRREPREVVTGRQPSNAPAVQNIGHGFEMVQR